MKIFFKIRLYTVTTAKPHNLKHPVQPTVNHQKLGIPGAKYLFTKNREVLPKTV